MKSVKQILPVVILTAIVVLYIAGLNKKLPQNLKGSDFNYAFTIKDLEGNIKSFDDYKNKVIFLNLWATWCGPCRAEMPSIQKLYNKTQSDDMVFIMLSIDREEDEAKVKNYIKRNNFSFPVVMPAGNLTAQLDVPSIPTTFIIDKEGKIIYQKVGSTNYDTEKFRKMLRDIAAK